MVSQKPTLAHIGPKRMAHLWHTWTAQIAVIGLLILNQLTADRLARTVPLIFNASRFDER